MRTTVHSHTMLFASLVRRLLNVFVLISILARGCVGSGATGRNSYSLIQHNSNGDAIFKLGNVAYLANIQHPSAVFSSDCCSTTPSEQSPITIIRTNASSISGKTLEAVIESYLDGDDVFSMDFLEALYLTSTVISSLEASATTYLSSLRLSRLYIDGTVKKPPPASFDVITLGPDGSSANLPAGPYVGTTTAEGIAFSKVYRLYRDGYRTFLFGAYDTNDGEGNFNPVDDFPQLFWDPMIPVPSRIYSWNDNRPLAGERVAIKDVFDVKGLQTSGGSQAWAYITPIANATAPAVQRIIDQGGIIVGKQKLAQFASAANPWEWQDEHYPYNPRGDGWLTCAASSSGGACSIAAYDWLDYAIGTDTGSSMRRPAAVAGVFGHRPSQGMISLERTVPLGAATDTAGVFSRNPYKWIKFAKAWYSPSLHESPEITGLPPLTVPDSDAFPKRILYPVDHLPLKNPRAQPILDAFMSNLSSLFNMTLDRINFTSTVQSWSNPIASNLTTLATAVNIINIHTQWHAVGKPLTQTWSALFNGRFPPLDRARRTTWQTLDPALYTPRTYRAALQAKRLAVDAYEAALQPAAPGACSESLLLYDIGTGGLPSFREESFNHGPNASFLVAPRPCEGSPVPFGAAAICPLFGCVDATVPIGQVPYFSPVSGRSEMVPVTVNMVVRRGCDFVLFNMIGKMADAGLLRTVKTGKTAF